MIKAFPKIFAIGTDYIRDIFQDEVEITEKVDGSQFVFGKIGGELYMRSKGKQMFPESYDSMFKQAVEYVISIEHILDDNKIYYCEYLQSPAHNALHYERIPENNLILFGICDNSDKFVDDYETLKRQADKINIEVVPLIYRGRVEKPEMFHELLARKSILGGECDIEGVVAKNYNKPFLLGGQPIPLMAGKFVSEKFKEIHHSDWSANKTAKGRFETFKTEFRTEARWEKAVQHLRDNGNLENSPLDIGNIIKEIQKDITEEEKENIKNFLWSEYSGEIMRYAVRGVPEWYKEKLLNSSFQ